jgi:hypothetical protein
MKQVPPFPRGLSEMSGGVVAAADEYGRWLRSFYDVRADWHRRCYQLRACLMWTRSTVCHDPRGWVDHGSGALLNVATKIQPAAA